MTNLSRRFEILLPLRFNDGQPVPDEFIVQALLELEQRFGAVSSEVTPFRGFWQHQGQVYRDDLVRIFMDVADQPANRQFFQEFKERMKTKFGQIDIWMTTFPVEIL